MRPLPYYMEMSNHMKITLNGKNMTTKKGTHGYIRGKLKTREYHGENLDALWDVLSTYDQPVQIRFVNTNKIAANLGDYGRRLIRVFQDAAKENKHITLSSNELGPDKDIRE